MFAVQRQTTGSRERKSGERSPERAHVPAQPMLAAQRASCACGGGCPRCREQYPLHTKLRVSEPGDTLEREADRIADAAMGAADARGSHSPQAGVSSSRGVSGRRDEIPPAVLARAETALGTRLNRVRVHADSEAHAAAASLQARAFTLGNDIWLGRGESADDVPLMVHEAAHVVQQNRGAVHGQIQRQPLGGTAPARRTTAYSFVDCTDGEMETLSLNIRQSYLMVINARDQMTSLILSIIQAGSSRDYDLSTDAILLRRVVGRLFGADTLDVLRDVRNNFIRIANRYRADREVICHHDPDRNQVASAAVSGTRIWIGPRFFSLYNDNLDSRPRIFIHEMAHNTGIEHDMTGIAIAAGETETRPAQVAHHADSYAELTYRIYARDFFGRMNRELDI